MKYQATATGTKCVTFIPGDGVGPECTAAARRIIEAAGVPIEWEEHHAGGLVFEKCIASGVTPATIESVRRTRVVFKGPLGTPVGHGEKSANVTLRKLFETYGNIRPVRELPGIRTPYTGRGVDLVIVRENVEDLYAGIEHMQTPGVAQCLKVISRRGCEKIVRLAFEYARSEGRQHVHCATKSNIMKLTEGMLKRTFEAVAPEYPEIKASHLIVDNCAHQLVKKPEQFEVIVMTNMNGDILSDLSSALIGGLGFAPSANLGNDAAIFEAVHGTAPKYAGKDCINPTAVILTGVLMLRHLDELEAAARIEHAVLVTLEQLAAEGRGTGDVVGYDNPKRVGTRDYTDRIIANLGKRSAQGRVRDYKPLKRPPAPPAPPAPKSRRVVGLDVFVESDRSPVDLGRSVEALVAELPVALKMIDNRGTMVYPPTGAITDAAEQSRCRLIARDEKGELSDEEIVAVLSRLGRKLRWSHVEKLQEFDRAPGFTKAQGED